MNWFDFVLLAIVVVSGIAGLKIGVIRVAFTVAGVVVGWLVAGQLSDEVGSLFDSSLSNETIVTVISYAIIVIAAAVVATYVAKIVRPMLTILTLGMSGMVDRVVGLAIGLLLGVALAGAVVMAATRLTYNFDCSADPCARAEDLASRVTGSGEYRETLEDALKESQLVSTFVTVTDVLPASALGFAPSDFKRALEILDVRIG